MDKSKTCIQAAIHVGIIRMIQAGDNVCYWIDMLGISTEIQCMSPLWSSKERSDRPSWPVYLIEAHHFSKLLCQRGPDVPTA